MTRQIADSTLSPGHYLRFELGDQIFAVPVDVVREVVEMVAFSSISHGIPVVKGAINYRGTIVPVVSGRLWMNLPDLAESPDLRMVVTEGTHGLLALVVDRVLDVVELTAQGPVEGGSTNRWAPNVAGVFWHAQSMIQVLRLERLLECPGEDPR